MSRSILLAALTTGLFCAGFTFVVEMVTELLTLTQALIAAMISGFCGSLFASFVLGRGGQSRGKK